MGLRGHGDQHHEEIPQPQQQLGQRTREKANNGNPPETTRPRRSATSWGITNISVSLNFRTRLCVTTKKEISVSKFLVCENLDVDLIGIIRHQPQ